ncbi:hypothetical protein MSMAW_1888 [Methanosarcina mazei WWM610]|uniref:Uncharacterized protein n=2 Tax=Methanosarcina mazei TaxID=2209 RepID=A0A0E3PYU2_METMZ|nr:hypothetical protein MSMAW_1888 [Methanosarcina mazei WWM610]
MYELEEQHQAELKEHEAKEKDEFLDSAVRAAEIKKATEFHKDACIIFTNTGVDPDELFEKMVQGIDDFISKIAKADSETQKRIVRDIMEGKTAWKLCPIK